MSECAGCCSNISPAGCHLPLLSCVQHFIIFHLMVLVQAPQFSCCQQLLLTAKELDSPRRSCGIAKLKWINCSIHDDIVLYYGNAIVLQYMFVFYLFHCCVFDIWINVSHIKLVSAVIWKIHFHNSFHSLTVSYRLYCVSDMDAHTLVQLACTSQPLWQIQPYSTLSSLRGTSISLMQCGAKVGP